MWIKAHETALFAQSDKFLAWADFIPFMLGGEPRANNSLANRTLLLDVKNNEWSQELLDWSGIPREKLGKIAVGGDVIGSVPAAVATDLGIAEGALIIVGGHDQCTNALGSGCIRAGTAVAGMGTYECYTPVFELPADPHNFLKEGMNIEAHVLRNLFVSFLYNHSGLLVNWFIRAFAPNERLPEGKNIFDVLHAEMPDEPTRLLFLPYNEPPQWPRYLDGAAGVFAGMTMSTTRGELYKALLEGITFFFADVIDALKRARVMPDRFLASGGGSRSDAWMQLRADILDIPFTLLALNEGSLTGAAMLAGVGAGLFSNYDEAVAAYVRTEKTYEPNPARTARYRESVERYRQVYPAMAPILRSL